MGLFGSSKNLAEQLAEANARVSQLEGEIAQAAKERDEARDLLAQQQQAIEAAAVRAEQDAEAVKDAGARAVAAEAEAAELKRKLAVPPDAYADASPGRQALAEGGGEGALVSLWDEYYAIQSPADRTRFWRENRDAMEKESRRN